MSRYSGTYATLAVHATALEAIWESIKQIGGPFGANYISDHQQDGQHELAVRFGDICLIPYGEIPPSIELNILAWAEGLWGERSHERLGLKLGEEAGEVLGAVIKIPEARATVKDMLAEVGDVLIVLAQIAAKHGTTLDALLKARYEFVRARGLRAPLPLVEEEEMKLDDTPVGNFQFDWQVLEKEEFTEVGTSPIAKALLHEKTCPKCGPMSDCVCHEHDEPPSII